MPPAAAAMPKMDFSPTSPNRSHEGGFPFYHEGIGGGCDYFSPPTGYWCSNASKKGQPWSVPVGATLSSRNFPNQPYSSARSAVVHAKHWRHWASRMHEVGDYSFDRKSGLGTFKFSTGGFQDGRGGGGSEVYVENVREELDVQGEWFYDEESHRLYLFHNATAGMHPAPGSLVAIASDAITLFNVTGSQATPVTDVQFKGVGFRDTAYTYMAPHGMPSGGDWALQRHAALIFEGTEDVLVDGCVFERLDGNAVIVSGYGRYATLTDNSFSWIGDTAIALWGRTTGDPLGVDGWDGSDGNQPRKQKR